MNEKRLITETVQEPIARDLPGDPCWVWRWLDIGGGGNVSVYAEAPDLPREDDDFPTECEPGTPLNVEWLS